MEAPLLLDFPFDICHTGTEKKTKLVLVPIDLKRKSSENLPVDSKQLKTAEPVLVATLLSPSSTSTAAEEALSSSAVDQPEHWQVWACVQDHYRSSRASNMQSDVHAESFDLVGDAAE